MRPNRIVNKTTRYDLERKLGVFIKFYQEEIRYNGASPS